MIRYKGSIEGVERCVNTFLNIIGVRDGCRIEVINGRYDLSNTYRLRIGLKSRVQNISILKDMLSYILPTGYFVEIYFYEGANTPSIKGILKSRVTELHPLEGVNTQVRTNKVEDTFVVTEAKEEHRTLNTVQLSTVYDPTNTKV
jgi:hypothetical protein